LVSNLFQAFLVCKHGGGAQEYGVQRSTAWASAKVGMPAVAADSGPCGGPWGGRGKFAAPGLPVLASLSSSGSSKPSVAMARLSRLHWMVVMVE